MIGHFILAAWLTACTADAVTSHYDMTALGTHEISPVSPTNKWAIDGVAVAEIAAGSLILHKLHGKTSRKVVITAMLVSAAAHGLAARHNYELTRR
jgi:hypothetical protein